MNRQATRRQFVFSGSVASAAAALTLGRNLSLSVASQAALPMDHHFQHGLAAYSFRKYFGYFKGKSQKPAEVSRQLDMFQFIEYCARQGIAGAELTSYFFPPDADDDYFRKIKRHAFGHGVTICGTAIGNNFSMGKGEKLESEVAMAKSWIDKATLFGAPHIRFFAGTAKELAKDPDNLKRAIDALQECVDYASQRGVFVGVENHGRLTAEQMLAIVSGVESPWFGVNLDTGNFVSEDPYRDLELVAPHAVSVQLKTQMTDLEGQKYPADWGKVATILKNAEYHGFIVLEFEETNPWESVPQQLKKLADQFL